MFRLVESPDPLLPFPLHKHSLSQNDFKPPFSLLSTILELYHRHTQTHSDGCRLARACVLLVKSQNEMRKGPLPTDLGSDTGGLECFISCSAVSLDNSGDPVLS